MSHYYAKAQSIRAQIKKHFSDVFNQVDYIISPVSPHIAPLKNTEEIYSNDDYMQDMYTV
jgi:Asp-tRNA(Asn)/Glu-tRNA(Gln) amidotransferase A subunit family amidase